VAGHRKNPAQGQTSKPRRPVRQRDYWRAEIAKAGTSEQLFDTAARWMRAVTAYLPADQRTAVLNQHGRWLASQADELARAR